MTEFTKDGLHIDAHDLSEISPKADDDERMYHHDGSSSISMVGGGSTSQRGYYVWDSGNQAWYSLFNNADKLDGKESGAFVHRDGSLPMQGDLNFGHYGLIDIDFIESGVGKLTLNSNNVTLKSVGSGADVRLEDSNGLLLLNAQEGGNVNAPNGTLSEKGNRVATRTWTNNNADVSNADYADNADAVDGNDASAFLHVSGDQMEGVLDLGGYNIEDGTDILWNGTNSEVPQVSLGGPASSLSAYPLAAGDLSDDYALTSRFPLPASDLSEDYALTSRFPVLNSDLSNSSVTVTAGTQLTGGGSVSLGSSITINVDETGLDADTVDGQEYSDIQNWVNTSSDVPNADYADSAGDSDTLDGEHASAFADAVHTHGADDITFGSTPLSIPVTKWADGLTDVEVFRYELQAGESLEVRRLEIQPRNGGDVTGLDVDVYDETNATVIASTGDLTTGSPVGSSGDGANVSVRISNSSGSSQNASVGGQINIV